MLGPLPRLYRILVAVSALTVFAAAGAWAAFMIPYPVLLSMGASVGLAVGALCAFLLLRHSSDEQGLRPSRLEHRRRP